MQEEEFVALIDKLEVYAHQHPARYRLRVGVLAALGYFYLIAVIGTVLFLLVGFIYARFANMLLIKLLLIPLGFVVIILRALWIEFPEPEGQELKYEDAPRLFGLVKEIRVATNGPAVHKILLTDEYNAGIVQRPRLGMFGWPENYLLVGLPLLRALSPDDVRAVMAHEFGHLSGSHGKFSAWIYRVRQTWTQVMQNLEDERLGSGIVRRFFNWYAPYFQAYSFVLARAQEYEADRCSVAVAGKENAAWALINLKLKEKGLTENFWPSFYERADEQPEPPDETFSEMLASLNEVIAKDNARAWFSVCLVRRHSYYDTHPALADRLESMGYSNLSEHADVDAFALSNGDLCGDEYFLARAPQEFIQSKNNWWREQLAEKWSERHQFVAKAEEGLVTLAEKAANSELTLEELWDRAEYTAGTQGNVAAIPFLLEVLKLMPEHVMANYTLGRALLEQGEEAGIKHIELAMEKDPSAIPAGCAFICEFLNQRKRNEEAEKYQRCITNYYEEVQLATLERKKVSMNDRFESHGLSAQELEDLQTQLAKFPNLVSARLVRKVVEHFPETPQYVLGVIAKHRWYLVSNNRLDHELVNELGSNATFPGRTSIVAMEQNFKWLRRVLKRIEDSEIYRAPSS